MIIGNYSITSKTPCKQLTNVGPAVLNSATQFPGAYRGRFYGETWTVGITDTISISSGHYPPYAHIVAPHAGGIGTSYLTEGAGTISASGAMGKNGESTLAGSGDISSANLGLILSAISTLSGVGGLSADAIGALNASATLAGQGNFTASLGALAGLISSILGQGNLSSDINAEANLAASIYVNQSTATVNELVAGVWNALAADFNTSGTMGEKLNAAGTAGDPWTTDLSGYDTAGTAGKIMKDTKKNTDIIPALL